MTQADRKPKRKPSIHRAIALSQSIQGMCVDGESFEEIRQRAIRLTKILHGIAQRGPR